MNEVEIAWAAGLFEGEGCVARQPHHKVNGSGTYDYVSYVLKVAMTDEDVIHKLQRVLGGKVYTRKTVPDRKQAWTWQLAQESEVLRIARLFRPHMGLRRGADLDLVILEIEAKLRFRIRRHEAAVLRKREYNLDRHVKKGDRGG